MDAVTGPISSCSREHLEIYQTWFNFADSDRDGRLTGNDAASFFAMSSLSKPELKQVWAIADSKRQGFIGFKEFVTAMKARSNYMIESYVLAVNLEKLNPPSMEGLDVLLKSYTSLTSVTSVIDGLKILYNEKLKPLEATYRFNDFVSPFLTSSDFDAKPMVMLLGQYSTGKTTFIKHLLQSNYPGAHIGPEPTTDRFIVVMSGPDERSIPGNTVAVHADLPFTGLATFGGSFLSKFECSQMPHPLLEHITFVDTPGVLSGEKQRTQRSYDFTGVISWFAAKCDLILLLFDPHKLDISDEFKRLMRVYGALMWSLGKVLNTPEVSRVYIGSFNDKPVNEAAIGPVGKDLFEKEQEDLLLDLIDIPKKACDRRPSQKEMPTLMGKAKAQRRLIDKLEDVFEKVQKEYHLPAGDFPSVEQFKEVLGRYNIDDFEKLKPKMIQVVDDMLGYDIPELLKNFRISMTKMDKKHFKKA
ncbi:hypothetical protein DH2020_017253 [Rehmannia glutinosa]|uniref:EH domain-containing protein n=1 Tax=Rehmannia glutinosa TaxID=99300 RepID=A0ABR0WQB1_REHGL